MEVGRAELCGALQQRGRLGARVLQLALRAEQRRTQRLQVSSGSRGRSSRSAGGGSEQQRVRLLQGLVQLQRTPTQR